MANDTPCVQTRPRGRARVALLDAIRGGCDSPQDLADRLGIALNGVRRHLGLLLDSGAIVVHKRPTVRVRQMPGGDVPALHYTRHYVAAPELAEAVALRATVLAWLVAHPGHYYRACTIRRAIGAGRPVDVSEALQRLLADGRVRVQQDGRILTWRASWGTWKGHEVPVGVL